MLSVSVSLCVCVFTVVCIKFVGCFSLIQLQPSSEKLYNDFVDPVLSVQEVNIDDNHRKDLEAKLKSPSGDMFDEAQHQVLLIVLYNTCDTTGHYLMAYLPHQLIVLASVGS